jgi:hypothetical protein
MRLDMRAAKLPLLDMAAAPRVVMCRCAGGEGPSCTQIGMLEVGKRAAKASAAQDWMQAGEAVCLAAGLGVGVGTRGGERCLRCRLTRL